MKTPDKEALMRSLWTKAHRLSYQREYRAAFAKNGGQRVDLYVDGKLNTQLTKSLASYGYRTHPGAAIARFLKDTADENPE